jgi:hypothetical protein
VHMRAILHDADFRLKAILKPALRFPWTWGLRPGVFGELPLTEGFSWRLQYSGVERRLPA